MADAERVKIAPGTLKAAERYMRRLGEGHKIMRDAGGRLQWTDGWSVATKTVEYLLAEQKIRELDTDLFGDARRGQTIGLPA